MTPHDAESECLPHIWNWRAYPGQVYPNRTVILEKMERVNLWDPFWGHLRFEDPSFRVSGWVTNPKIGFICRCHHCSTPFLSWGGSWSHHSETGLREGCKVNSPDGSTNRDDSIGRVFEMPIFISSPCVCVFQSGNSTWVNLINNRLGFWYPLGSFYYAPLHLDCSEITYLKVMWTAGTTKLFEALPLEAYEKITSIITIQRDRSQEGQKFPRRWRSYPNAPSLLSSLRFPNVRALSVLWSLHVRDKSRRIWGSFNFKSDFSGIATWVLVLCRKDKPFSLLAQGYLCPPLSGIALSR